VKKLVAALAVLSLAAHLAYLPPTLEDLDSVNFALGVRDFDVARHQPHPPGYPAFIALGKLGTTVLAASGVSAPEVRGLAVWSALAAGALPLLVFAFFGSVGGEASERRAAGAALLTACCPLVWFTGVRPLSDMAGLAVAFGALAALAPLLRTASLRLRAHDDPARASAGPGEPRTANRESRAANREPRASASARNTTTTALRRDRAIAGRFSSATTSDGGAILGAFLAGLAIGFRSQMALLTIPLVVAVMVMVPRLRLRCAIAVATGIAAWAVPLVVASGGPAGYLTALRSQAGEDFSGVVMLWTHRTVRVAFAAFVQTFVRPWDSPILGGVMIALAAAGALVAALHRRRTLAIIAIVFAPYAVFHLLFQETVTIRYALPLIPAIAYLAAETIEDADSRVSIVLLAALAVVGVSTAFPAMTAFARTPSPTFGLLAEMRMFHARGAQPVVGMHRRVFTESRRARLYAGDVPGTLLPTPRDFEWLETTRAWREGHDGETWFVADPRRTDLALIDKEHTRTRQYRWPFDRAVYVGGARPDEIDWHVIDRPGWFLEHGWALTPEIAGVADREGWGPHRRPSVGWLRRRPSETLMMIGGRHLGGDPPVRITVNVDAREVAALDVRPGYFLEFVTLPAGTLNGEGRFAKLTVSAQTVGGGATPPVGIEQFNLQDPDRVVFGFDQGWFEPEFNPTTARSWRWMSEKAVVRVHAPGRNVVVRLTAESPLRYFDAAPHVRISAGDRVLSELRPSSDFSAEVQVPADALTATNGLITLTSDRAYVAGEREGSGDRRRLALRVYSLSVEAQPR
jgi:hypothetical protein